MLTILYVIIFAFYLDLNLDGIVTARSFEHGLQKLVDVSYLKRDMITYVYRKTMQQLKGCTIKVSQKKCKQVISEMFAAKLKFEVDYPNYFQKKVSILNFTKNEN